MSTLLVKNQPYIICLFVLMLTGADLSLFAQNKKSQAELKTAIDSIVKYSGERSFSGNIIVVEKGKNIYSYTDGFYDLNQKRKIKSNSQFVIGSISKQITAAMILREVEKGKLELHVPIRQYYPELTQSWADQVTIHHLLTHTDGIKNMNEPLLFAPGSQFRYNQINFDILSKILEHINSKTFAEQSAELFRQLGMKHTWHPDTPGYDTAITGISRKEDRQLTEIKQSYRTSYAAAGGFISTAHDLALWNTALHEGKILSSPFYELMITPKAGAVRDHPIFGQTEYGYGITTKTENGILQVGQTGYSEGFASMNFYFPQQQISLIVLQNETPEPANLRYTFRYHVQILNKIWECL